MGRSRTWWIGSLRSSCFLSAIRPTGALPAQRVLCAPLVPHLGRRAARELRRFFAAPQYRLRIFLPCVAAATANNLLRWYSLCHVRRYDLG
jgi:hypothetical protein